jgi:hypothetical protein
MKNKPSIQREVYKDEELVEYVAKKEAKKFGKHNSHIILPKGLVNKTLVVQYFLGVKQNGCTR